MESADFKEIEIGLNRSFSEKIREGNVLQDPQTIKKEILKDFSKNFQLQLLEHQNRQHETKQRLNESKKLLVEKNKERRKNKGPREKMFFDILVDELKIQFQPLYGELSMTGNHCWKFINNYERMAPCFDGIDEWDKFKELFSRFQTIAYLLYKITPSLAFDSLEEERKLEQEEDKLTKEKEKSNQNANEDLIVNGSTRVNENANEKETVITGKQPRTENGALNGNLKRKHVCEQSCCECSIPEPAGEILEFMENCLDFGNFFTENFDRTPTPKCHILTYHAPQFLSRWFSIGMFAEQGCESLHGSFNHQA